MKKIIIILLIFPFLLAMMCEPVDPPCGNNLQFRNDNLINIEENKTTFQLGDTLWLNATVNRNQIFNEESIDLFEYNKLLSYYVEFYKTSNYDQDFYIILNNSLLVSDNGDNFILIKQNDDFVNRTGIKLLEKGNYKIRTFAINFFNQDYDCTQTRLYLETTILNSDADYFYHFNVE